MSYCYLHWPEESLCKLKMMMTFIKVKGQQRSNVVNYVLWLPYLVTRTAETMVKESKVKERSNFTKYRRNVRLCSDLFTDLVTLAVGKLVNFCDHKAITRMFIGKHVTTITLILVWAGSMGKCLIRC